MPGVNAFGAGPQSFSGITWTSTNSATQGGSVFGYTGPYGFNANGNWNGVAMAGVNDSTDAYNIADTMTFTFDKAVSAFGGEINCSPAKPPSISRPSTPATICSKACS